MTSNLTFCVKSLKICVEYHVTKLLANFLLERGANFKQSYPTAFSTAETNWCEVSISDLFCVGTQSVVHNGAKIFLKSYSNFLLEFVSSTNYHGPIYKKIQKCEKGKTLYSCETPSSFCKSNNDFILNKGSFTNYV